MPIHLVGTHLHNYAHRLLAWVDVTVDRINRTSYATHMLTGLIVPIMLLTHVDRLNPTRYATRMLTGLIVPILLLTPCTHLLIILTTFNFCSQSPHRIGWGGRDCADRLCRWAHCVWVGCGAFEV